MATERVPLGPYALGAAVAAVRHGARIELDTRHEGPLTLVRWDGDGFTLTTDAATLAGLLLLAPVPVQETDL